MTSPSRPPPPTRPLVGTLTPPNGGARWIRFIAVPRDKPRPPLPCPRARWVPNPAATGAEDSWIPDHALSIDATILEGQAVVPCGARVGGRACGAIVWLLVGIHLPNGTPALTIAEVRYREMVDLDRRRMSTEEVLEYLSRTPLLPPE
jgi:hypothetical protein